MRELIGKKILAVDIKEAISEDGEQQDTILQLMTDGGLFEIVSTDPVSERYCTEIFILDDETREEYSEDNWKFKSILKEFEEKK